MKICFSIGIGQPRYFVNESLLFFMFVMFIVDFGLGYILFTAFKNCWICSSLMLILCCSVSFSGVCRSLVVAEVFCVLCVQFE